MLKVTETNFCVETLRQTFFAPCPFPSHKTLIKILHSLVKTVLCYCLHNRDMSMTSTAGSHTGSKYLR